MEIKKFKWSRVKQNAKAVINWISSRKGIETTTGGNNDNLYDKIKPLGEYSGVSKPTKKW